MDIINAQQDFSATKFAKTNFSGRNDTLCTTHDSKVLLTLMKPKTSPAKLIAHWPFSTDFENIANKQLRIINHNVDLSQQAAHFNGRDSFLEIASHPNLDWGNDNFSISLWIETKLQSDVVGDLLSKYDSASRRGWTLGVVTNSGVTSTAQPNYRHLHFGIDNGDSGSWTDCGRPGNAVFIYSMATVGGQLYAGTFEIEADQTGHLWRYAGDGNWQHCGATPDGSNSIPTIVDFGGELYCASGRYNPIGSRLGSPQNTAPGGHVYRISTDGAWHDCGIPGSKDAVPEEVPTSGYATGKADEIYSLTVFREKLYATSFHQRGAYVYEGGTEWKYIGPDSRLMSFTVYQDELYALANGGPVYRYDGGENWTLCGTPGASQQTYAAATYRGELLVGTWPNCEVLRYDGEQNWTNFGRAGYEMEVMAMALYNAKIYFGTLPMANVWRLDDNDYAYIGNIDNSPEAYLRRVWSMAVYQGKLFTGTLPSGKVLSYEAGRMATHDQTLPAGRHHIAAVRDDKILRLYIDGKIVAQSSPFNATEFDLNTEQPLKIGFGAHQYFAGTMSDLRLYHGALTAEEIQELQ